MQKIMIGAWMAVLLAADPGAVGAQDVYVYPAKNQTDEQMARDKEECHDWAVKQTGVDPEKLASEAVTPPPQSDVRRCRGRSDPGRGHRSARPRRPRATGDGGAAPGKPAAGLSAAKDAAPELRPRLQRLPHRPRLLRAVAAPASLALLTSAARATGAGGVGGGLRSPDPYLLRVGEAEDRALVAGQSGHADRNSAWSGERTPPRRQAPPRLALRRFVNRPGLEPRRHLALPASHEGARIGHEARDDELVRARRHGPPDLGEAIAG